MLRTATVIISNLVFLTLIGCFGGKAEGPAAITGYVYDDATGDPIGGAVVVLSPSEITLRTRPDGSYRFDELPRGSYTLRASATGFQEALKKGVRVSPGKVEWVKFFLKRPPASSEKDN